MRVIEILSGPVIGATIGYFTNYIAIKMLFRPLNPVKIGGFTVPFTPGVIPKRKKALAKALGTTISSMLITKEELEKALLSEKMKQGLAEGIAAYLMNGSDTEMTIRDTLNGFIYEKDYEAIRVQIQNLLSERMAAGLSGIDLGKIIANEGGAALKEKLQGTMLAMMLNDGMIAALAQPIGERVKDYIQHHGAEIIQPVVMKEIESLENQKLSAVLEKVPINENMIKELVGRIYTQCITGLSDTIAEKIDIAGIVKTKIEDMDVKDMEKLTLSVMKTELDTVVNLGAGLGFIIGLLNMFF